jgi:hypothetical protein
MSPEGLRKTTKNLSQDSRSPGPDLNPGTPEYEGVNHSTTVLGSCYAICFLSTDSLSFLCANSVFQYYVAVSLRDQL